MQFNWGTGEVKTISPDEGKAMPAVKIEMNKNNYRQHMIPPRNKLEEKRSGHYEVIRHSKYPPVDLPYTYMRDYLNSAGYQYRRMSNLFGENPEGDSFTMEMYLDGFNNKNKEFAPEIKWFTDDVEAINKENAINVSNMHSALSKISATDKGSSVSVQERSLYLDPEQAKRENTPLDDIVAHELGHTLKPGNQTDQLTALARRSPLISDAVNYRFPKDADGFNKWIDNRRKVPHDLNPEERKSDLDAFRYQLWKNGIYDSREITPFSKDHLQKVKAHDVINKTLNYRRLKDHYNDDNLIWIMNHISQNSKKDEISSTTSLVG
jgi:hypothetical protein